jgi:hypothetical protein
MDISTLCTPLIIQIFLFFLYLVSYIYIIINDFSKYSTSSLIFNVLSSLLWIWLTSYLCNNGYMFMAWLIIIIPLFIGFFAVISYLLVSLNFLSNKTQETSPSVQATEQAVAQATAQAIATARAMATAQAMATQRQNTPSA